MEMNLDDHVLDLIERDDDIEGVLERLEEDRPASFEMHRVALRYVVTSNSRAVSLLDPARRRAVFDFIDRVHEKTRGHYLQCAACGNPVPIRGGALTDDTVAETMARHMGSGCP